MKSNELLKKFIIEVLSASPRQVNKNLGNIMYFANGHDIVGINRRGGGVIDDEKMENERARQEKKQAACCLVFKNGYVLAVSRKDDPTAFGLPGGKVDPGEEPIDAAARELQEETGLTALNLKQVYVRQDADGYVTTTFVCNVEGNINTTEAGVVRWVKPEVLFAGPFGEYNVQLWKRLGLPV